MVYYVAGIHYVFVTMSVTIKRYFTIVHPLKHFSGKRYLLLISIVTTILYNIPKFFEFQRTQVTEKIGSTCSCMNLTYAMIVHTVRTQNLPAVYILFTFYKLSAFL